MGIENFTFAHQLSNTINDVHPYQLKAFDENTSLRLLKALEESYKIALDDAVRKAVLDKIRYYLPYFIQIVFGKIHELISLEQARIDVGLVDRAYAEILEENHLNTWIERLKEQYGELETDAFLLLRHICQEQNGSKRNNLFALLDKKYKDTDKSEDRLSTLLYMLKNDGYLIEEAGLYYFRSPLLRDFWYNRFVK